MKRIFSLATILVLLFVAHSKATAQSLLAGWDFQTAPGTAAAASPNTPTTFTANVGTGTLYLNGTNGASSWSQSTELSGFAGTALNAGTGMATSTSGASALALLGGTSNSANGKSVVFSFSMTGYQNLVITYATQRSNTGFTSQVWEYSTNGTTWSSLQTLSSIPTTFAVQTLNTVTGLDNIATAYVRLTVAGASAASGNNRLDNIQLNATAIPSSSATDAFRTKASGNWNSTATWESSSNGTTWINATLTPTSAAGAITIQNGHTVTTTANITIDQTTIASGGILNINPGITLTLNNGTGTDLTVATGGSLAFLSDATGSGRLANLGAATLGQNANVTVQRYIPAKTLRKYDFIAAPVTAVIASAWQQQIHITGPGTGGTICSGGIDQGTPNANGFDVTNSNNPSFFTYTDTAPYWNSISSTTQNLTPGTGYRVNIRGDRNDGVNGGCQLLTGTTPPAPSAVTLSATGTLATGSVNVTIDEGYELLGNPYPSEIDFTAFQASNSSVITANLYLYNPQRAAGVNAYTTVNGGTAVGGTGALPGGYTNPAIIASGQAFFVERQANGIATFSEAHKSATTQTGLFKTTTWNDIIRIGLERAADSLGLDDIAVRFDAVGSLAYNSSYDARSINSGNHLTSLKGSEHLAIQTRPVITTPDTVGLFLNTTATSGYNLHFTEHQSMNANIYLLDHYTSSVQDIKANPYYLFSTDANSLSQGASRFELVFVPYTTSVGGAPDAAIVTVYPNPASRELNVQLRENHGDNYEVYIADAQGRKVWSEKASAVLGVLKMNTTSLAPGMYFIEVKGENNFRATGRFIK